MGRRKTRGSNKSRASGVLDLHGIKHAEVELMVENFVLLNPLPLEVITGNSNEMKRIVKGVLNKHSFKYMDGCLWNTGVIKVIG